MSQHTASQQPVSESQIFRAAVKLSAEDRERYLDDACHGDQRLRAEVEALLRAHDPSRSFLFPPAAAVTLDRRAPEQVGTLIGPYKLLEQIGEGGMGLVYMAEQQQPVRRLVALKLIKPGMDSKQVIARFEAERQALAMMDHPNIAKILDAGMVGENSGQEPVASGQLERSCNSLATGVRPLATAPSGRPYFVMELVRGLPINEFCDTKRLAVRERLQLFIQVCQAVQHAHQKGIIHRDLKPSNVLVAMADTVAFPKLLDFGIAKALGQSLTDGTLHTGYSQLVGTPLYMSPEQAEMNVFGVDTRSDVYSLGVLLYELLTGTTPFDKDRLKSATFDEMRRIIREEEPETVSQRIARTRRGIGVSPVLSSRHTPCAVPSSSPATSHQPLASRLSELDWIVMKALEKDRSRRYESASALAADIQRYLSDEPVLACPPTTMYRFQKFARKHKPALATAAAIAACLILGTTVSAWQAARATTAEAQANANEQKAVANEQKAIVNEQKAVANAAAAVEKEQEAIKQRDEVKSLNDALQRTLYAAHMNLARNAWETGSVARVVDLLEQHRPKAGESDLRGFEWYYLNRLCHPELLTIKDEGGNAVFSPDGKRLAAGTKIWDVQTGREVLALQGAGGAKIFSLDGKRLAGNTEKEVKVWDALTGQELLILKVQPQGVRSVAFSPDGKHLASTSLDRMVMVWDSQTGQQILALKGHTSRVTCVEFSPDGKRLASASDGGIVLVWDVQTGQELLIVKGGFYDVAFSPDGKRISAPAFVNSANVPKVWDAETGRELLACEGKMSWLNTVAYSPDGKRLAAVGGDRTVRVWDAETGQELLALKGHSDMIMSVEFSPDGTRLATADGSGTVMVWDATNRSRVQSGSSPAGNPLSMAFSPDGIRLTIARGTGRGTIKVSDGQTGKELFVLREQTVAPNGAAFNLDGKRLVSASADKKVRVWDAQTGQELATFNGDTKGVPGANSVAFSPDSKRVASAHGHTVKVWDAQTGQEILAFNTHTSGFNRVAFSPDGKRLATFAGETMKVWDAQTGQELLSLQAHNAQFTAVSFSRDGFRLATGSNVGFAGGGEVKVWDAKTGNELLNFKGHTATVSSVVFSPDGKRLASGSGSRGGDQLGELKVWDAQTGEELLTINGGGHRHAVAFSPNGYLLASDAGGTVTIYDATPLPEKP